MDNFIDLFVGEYGSVLKLESYLLSLPKEERNRDILKLLEVIEDTLASGPNRYLRFIQEVLNNMRHI